MCMGNRSSLFSEDNLFFIYLLQFFPIPFTIQVATGSDPSDVSDASFAYDSESINERVYQSSHSVFVAYDSSSYYYPFPNLSGLSVFILLLPSLWVAGPLIIITTPVVPFPSLTLNPSPSSRVFSRGCVFGG